MPKPAPAASSPGLEIPDFSNISAAACGNGVMVWPECLVDAFQGGVLFLDLLRQRSVSVIVNALRLRTLKL
ncbi:MAG: hypothetical protein WCC64_16510 [Aliidongia sp.]